MSSALVWELVKNYNCFMKSNLNGTLLTAEAGNLYNKHSYKFSGLVDAKTVDVKADGDAVRLSIGRPKNAAKPKVSKHSIALKRNAARVNKAAVATVSAFRPDLTYAAKARASAVSKSLRVKKAKKSA